MLPKRNLTTATPDTLILGIASNGQQTAITAAIRLLNGNIEGGVAEDVAEGLWPAMTGALDDLHTVRAKHLIILTTCDELHQFLQKPIYIEQPEIKKVRMGKTVFTARVGGNEHQWRLLHQLFRYVWRCERVEKLEKAEAMLNASS